MVQIANDREFKVGQKIIGAAGAHNKRIIAEATEGKTTDLKLRLRGAGSGYREHNRQSWEALQVCVSASTYEIWTKAVKLMG